jgi:UDP-N-acetylmuramoyl-L-alanyl-D-glutamate--2,6-diaminopimelate ligase
LTLGVLVGQARSLAPDARTRVTEAGRSDTTVTNITHDSRAVSNGAVFVAIRGRRADGATFTDEAIRRGAAAIVAETPAPAGVSVPWILTPDARLALAELAGIFFGHPSEQLQVIGVTGTNGKTTSTYLLAAVFDAAGQTCGRMGTVTVRVGPQPADERDASHTTPEAPDLQRLLREMLDHGCKTCAMEVSSHALVLQRVAGLRFSAAIFTNLTRDHLDFHLDMKQYFAAKRRLFEMLPAGAPAVVNVDDPYGQELAAKLPAVVTYAIQKPADVRAVSIQSTLEGLAFQVERASGGPLSIRSSLVGRPNVYNILGVVAVASALGVPDAAIEAGLSRLEGVPGRFQLVSATTDDVRVVVDYAHTDDALKNLLETARPLTSGRLITVFGCGGDRDRSKRPLMGTVAARLSDMVVLTSDNPRSEDPNRIIDEIKLGIVQPVEPGAPKRATTPLLVNVDRRRAIEQAIRTAQAGDLVIVAGKGHEKYQVIGDRTIPFDDVEIAQAALQGRRRGSPV